MLKYLTANEAMCMTSVVYIPASLRRKASVKCFGTKVNTIIQMYRTINKPKGEWQQVCILKCPVRYQMFTDNCVTLSLHSYLWQFPKVNSLHSEVIEAFQFGLWNIFLCKTYNKATLVCQSWNSYDKRSLSLLPTLTEVEELTESLLSCWCAPQ